MSTETTSSKNSIVDELNFTSRTLKRATWEMFEFTIVGPYLVEVANASYGHLMHEHAYLVGIEDRGGLLVPSECECPADRYHETACKHRLALAVCGGPLLMQAAADYETTEQAVSGESMETVADKLEASHAGASPNQTPAPDAEADDCACAKLSDGFLCWACYRDGGHKLKG